MGNLPRVPNLFSGILLFGCFAVAIYIVYTKILSSSEAFPTWSWRRSNVSSPIGDPTAATESQQAAITKHAQSSLSSELASSEDNSSPRPTSPLSPTTATLTMLNQALPVLRDDLPLIGNFTKTHWADSSEVPRRISIEEYDVMIELLRVVDDVFRKNNVSYAVIGGTLLGSYYHHDMVPWDDDVGIAVDMANMDRTMQLLGSVSANYSVAKISWPIVKFYKTEGRRVPSSSWTWPLIDIFFYHMTSAHWWVSKSAVMPLAVVFPLHLRPFGPLWVPSPNDAKEYINIEQDFKNRVRQCASNKYNHANEEVVKWVTVPCEGLMNTYPFVVEWTPVAHSRQFIEEVRVGNETVQKLVVPPPS